MTATLSLLRSSYQLAVQAKMPREWLNTLDINSGENNLGWKYRFRNSQWSHGMDKRAQRECLLWEEGSEKNWGKVGYSGIKQRCLWAQVTKYGKELGEGPPPSPTSHLCSHTMWPWESGKRIISLLTTFPGAPFIRAMVASSQDRGVLPNQGKTCIVWSLY